MANEIPPFGEASMYALGISVMPKAIPIHKLRAF